VGSTVLTEQQPATSVLTTGPSPPPPAATTTAIPISLDQLEMGMVPVHSVQIEEIEADGTATRVK
jgi:hypothetical protein